MEIVRSKGKKNLISLKVSGNLNIYSVKEFKENIKKYLNKKNDLELNFNGIDKIDSAGFQMIIVLNKEIIKFGRKLKIVKPSDDVIRIFNLYNEESLISE